MGDTGFSFQIVFVDKNQADFDPFTSDFIGFLIFSKTECGATLLKDLDNANYDFIQQGEKIYSDYGHKYLRWAGTTAVSSFYFEMNFQGIGIIFLISNFDVNSKLLQYYFTNGTPSQKRLLSL